MSRTLKLADVVAAVGGVLLLVSSFLGGFTGSSYNSWHSLFINQLIVTDLLGFVAAVVIVLASLGLLPPRVPWTTWTAAVALVVLLNSIFAPIQVHEFLHQSDEHLKVGVGFYVAIIGAVLLVVGACLAWLPFLQVAVTGRPKAVPTDAGYQGPDGYAAYQGPAGQFSPPQPGYPGAHGATQPAGAGYYGAPTPSFQPRPGGEWAAPAPGRPDTTEAGPAIAGPVGAGSPPAPTGPRLDPSGTWTTPWGPTRPESTTAEAGPPISHALATDVPAGGVAPTQVIQVGSPVDSTPEPGDSTPEPGDSTPEPVDPTPEAADIAAVAAYVTPEATGPQPEAADAGPADAGAADVGAADVGSADVGAADVGAADVGSADVGSADLEPADAELAYVEAVEPSPVASEPAGSAWSPPETPRFEDAAQTTQAGHQASTPWGESQPPPAPPAPFAPFWAAVPVPRTVYSADQSGLPVGSLQPGIWYAVVANHASGGFIVQLPTGGHGVLVETTDIIRG